MFVTEVGGEWHRARGEGGKESFSGVISSSNSWPSEAGPWLSRICPHFEMACGLR